jgi:hypothetical protein
VTYLGVSPPVRCGAANPWAHNGSWARSAYTASHSNLQALRERLHPGPEACAPELDSTCDSAAAAARGAIDLLLAPSPAPARGWSAPPSGRAALGEGAGEGECGDGADPYGDDCEEGLSDAGSEATVAAPLALRAAPASAPARVPAPLPGPAGPAPAAPPPAAGSLPAGVPRGAGLLARSSLSASPAGAAATAPTAKPQPAGVRACSKQSVLEPFACTTYYYGLPA